MEFPYFIPPFWVCLVRLWIDDTWLRVVSGEQQLKVKDSKKSKFALNDLSMNSLWIVLGFLFSLVRRIIAMAQWLHDLALLLLDKSVRVWGKPLNGKSKRHDDKLLFSFPFSLLHWNWDWSIEALHFGDGLEFESSTKVCQMCHQNYLYILSMISTRMVFR